MKNWYIFKGSAYADIFSATNYTLLDKKPICYDSSKLCAIYAEDNGLGYPLIDRSTLTKDFIRAVQFEKDFGIVILSEQYKKKETQLDRLINKFIKFI